MMSTVIAGLYFAYGVFVVFTTINALRRPSPPTSRLPAIWILAMLNGELPLLTVLSRLAVTAGAWALGAFDNRVGRWGLWLVGLSLLGIPVLWWRQRRARRLLDVDVPSSIEPLTMRLTGWARRLPEHLEIDGPHHIAADVGIDFYRRADHDPETPHPTFVYLHGGSWTGGDPHAQSRPLLHLLADRGWLVATVRYPLSPAATFPDHLVGVKRALAWLRTEGPAHGVDPELVVIAGGSAGGHLAALAALTPNRPEYQPGFEEIDTSVAACVPMYGIYDFLNRNRTRHDWPVIPRVVMKKDPAADPKAFSDASPIDQVSVDAPPFLVVHGSHDSLVPPAEARVFVQALREVSRSQVQYLEVPGAQHAFDAVTSPRSRRVAAAISTFLDEVVISPSVR
ncbi:MAG: alpha/beta hydrolase [Acidimicrobiia bacterium]|nr:alpha/beta hydrolase [Acidimicrobiia bacterium]